MLRSSARPLLVATALLMAGCGDSLLGPASLGDLFDEELPPGSAAWELRWILDDDDGLAVGCELYQPQDELFLEELDLGFIEAPPPTDVFGEWEVEIDEEFSFSLALPVLVDAELIQEGTNDPLDGVWGVVPEYALLIAGGELDEMEAYFGLPSGALVQGQQWLSLDTPYLAETGDLAGSLWTTDQRIPNTETDGYLPVESLETASEDALELVSGEELGGLIGCGEDPE